MTVEVVDILAAPEEQRRELWQVYATVEEELQPMLPPDPYDEWLSWVRVPPDGCRRVDYVLRDSGGGVVGGARLQLDLQPERPHLCWLELSVRAEARRRGFGSALLGAAIGEAARDGRTTVQFWLPLGGPGDGFLERFGLHVGQVEQRNVLTVANIDRAAYKTWAQPAEGYELVRWKGGAPAEIVDRYATARRTMADAPLGELEYPPTEWTADRVRELEGMRRERGNSNWIVAAVHRKSGEVAGYTEILGAPARPDLLYQEDTAVVRAHRGHGLGRTVKAANALWVLDEWPTARWVQTWNAGDNEHMVAVNRELGYHKVAEWGAWQGEVADLATRLGLSGEPTGKR